jgi:hypothetical protein
LPGSDNPEIFWTPEQKKYAKAVAMSYASEKIHRMLKGLEFETKPQGPFGIGIRMKVTGGPQRSQYCYREKELETDVVCDRCTLVYAIYGAFAFCPDCGSHNSLTILSKNLEIADKLLALAYAQDHDIFREAEKQILIHQLECDPVLAGSATSSRCSGTPGSTPRRSTPTSTSATSSRSTAGPIPPSCANPGATLASPPTEGALFPQEHDR